MLAKRPSPSSSKAKHNASDQVSAVLNPVRGYRDQLRRSGVQPKDHARENLKKIKETQRRIKEEKEAAAQQATPVPFKLKKFANVESRITKGRQQQQQQQDGQESPREEDTRPTHKFLRKGERCHLPAGPPATSSNQNGAAESSARPLSGRSGATLRTRERLKDPVPKANELNTLAPRTNKNYIQNNARDVLARNQARRDRENAQRALLERASAKQHANFGRVPTYLLKRQAEILQAEARRAELDAGGCPPGMALMDEQERLRTLASLRQSADVTMNDLRKMPLTLGSMALRKRKEELEKQLEEQEAAIEIFSKDKVFLYE
ncbi:Enkurin domain-containing protein 1 [Hondaea fermentalgiana]|uniref:Enkurin domain-containing protein 1 n=1 Tax=Hondaea fermentalgiana TaxID=2315210 RepID=A0A2R5G8W7_9STRA|nr:Enkurin domain-containing protein 1 [Hondaea fermentalgiana]|eukprot:GBG26218.1 Enkurin domain-containing protein 1 [Hondaea fermentalgiana]